MHVRTGAARNFTFSFVVVGACALCTSANTSPGRPASSNTQLSSAARWLLNDCWSLLQINGSMLATVGELGECKLEASQNYSLTNRPVKTSNPLSKEGQHLLGTFNPRQIRRWMLRMTPTKWIGVWWEDRQGKGQANVAVTRLDSAMNGSPLSI